MKISQYPVAEVITDADAIIGNIGSVTKKIPATVIKEYIQGTDPSAYLTADKTVNLTSSLTPAEIQGLIDQQPKNLGGFALTFQFADGTYNFGTNTLLIARFYNGRINILGNAANQGLSTTKAVVLNFVDTAAIPIDFYLNNGVFLAIRRIKISKTTTIETDLPVVRSFVNNGCNFVMDSNYIAEINQVRKSDLFMCVATPLNNIKDCYFTGGKIALNIQGVSKVLSQRNGYSVDKATTGLYAFEASEIVKDGTQPEGATNELTAAGGLIR